MEKEDIKHNPPSPCVDGFNRIHICPSMYAAHNGTVLEKGFYACEDDITDKLRHITDVQKKFIQSFCSVPTKKLVEVFTSCSVISHDQEKKLSSSLVRNMDANCIKLTMRPTDNSTVIVINYNIEGSDESYSWMMVFVGNKLEIIDYMPNDKIITYLCNCIARFLEFEAPQEMGGY